MANTNRRESGKSLQKFHMTTRSLVGRIVLTCALYWALVPNLAHAQVSSTSSPSILVFREVAPLPSSWGSMASTQRELILTYGAAGESALITKENIENVLAGFSVELRSQISRRLKSGELTDSQKIRLGYLHTVAVLKGVRAGRISSSCRGRMIQLPEHDVFSLLAKDLQAAFLSTAGTAETYPVYSPICRYLPEVCETKVEATARMSVQEVAREAYIVLAERKGMLCSELDVPEEVARLLNSASPKE
jgi:hypothetical protein